MLVAGEVDVGDIKKARSEMYEEMETLGVGVKD